MNNGRFSLLLCLWTKNGMQALCHPLKGYRNMRDAKSASANVFGRITQPNRTEPNRTSASSLVHKICMDTS